MKLVTSFLLFILFIQTLPAQSGNKSKLTIINLEKSFSKQEDIPLSRFVDKITYIPLETRQETLIPNLANYEVTDEFIIVKTSVGGSYHILLFDRKTGKFIREIGKQGRGPGEFYIWSNVPYNPVRKEIYAYGYSNGLREILAYDLSGDFINNIKFPLLTDPKMKNEIPAGIAFNNMLDENIFVGYIPNMSGFEKKKLILLSKEGVIKIFPNHLTYDGTIKRRIVQWVDLFYKWDNKLYFTEAFCDTLYQVTKDSLIPRYYFDYGRFKAPYSKQNVTDRSEYFVIADIDENKNFIFIQLFYKLKMYTAFIDKRNNAVTICEGGTSDQSGLIDDINGLMDVIPKDFTQNNEMVYIIQPVKLINWLNENPEKAALARTKLPWLRDINEFSNPVIATGKCKE